jgi:transaldolase
VLKEICSLVEGPVSAEVVAVDTEGMLKEGKELAKIADNIVVKIPMLEAGMVAVRRLAADGIRTNVTLCFSSVQCLIAAKAGASYVSPFIGRLDDVGQEGMDVIREARVIFDNYGIETEILAASIRHPRHIVEAAMIGADVATLPPDVLKKLLLHPLTDRGLDQFLNDWSKLFDLGLAALGALRLSGDAGPVGRAPPHRFVAPALAGADDGPEGAWPRHPGRRH